MVRKSDAGKSDVYNLTVEGEPEFFANGVLVHNCDAGRYILINIGTGAEFTILPEQAAALDGLTPLKPLSAFAFRPDEAASIFTTDDDETPRGTTQQSPF